MPEQQAGQEINAESHVIQPVRALPRKYVEPILYLADRMSEAAKLELGFI